jgi:maltodextrin utilization protein YvdJ
MSESPYQFDDSSSESSSHFDNSSSESSSVTSSPKKSLPNTPNNTPTADFKLIDQPFEMRIVTEYEMTTSNDNYKTDCEMTTSNDNYKTEFSFGDFYKNNKWYIFTTLLFIGGVVVYRGTCKSK